MAMEKIADSRNSDENLANLRPVHGDLLQVKQIISTREVNKSFEAFSCSAG